MERMEAPARRVVLGVTGSIAAYKAAEIIRLFRKEGIEVHVVMTPSAGEFITPMTLGTLSGNPVTVDLFSAETGGPYMEWGEEKTGGGIRHIQASRAAELILVAPATGNLLGKVAAGIADEPLSTAILASSVKVLFAPAMNTMMWENAAVRGQCAHAACLEAMSSSIPSRAIWPAASSAGARWPIRWSSSIGLSADGTGAARPAAGSRHCRRDAGAARSRPRSRESIEREDGIRGRRGGPQAGIPRDARARRGFGAAAPRGGPDRSVHGGGDARRLQTPFQGPPDPRDGRRGRGLPPRYGPADEDRRRPERNGA